MPSRALPIPAERVKMAAAVVITGEDVRTLQALAAAGRIPGAAKLSRNWSFDEAKLRAWVRGKERERWQNDQGSRGTATGAGRSYGVEPKSPAKSTGGAY